MPHQTTSAQAASKFSSLLKTPVDTKLVDLARASKWLAHYLKKECPKHEQIISAIMLNHMDGHRMPDPKVLQVNLTHLALISQDQIRRLMRKFWERLLDDQANQLEKDSGRHKISTHQTSDTTKEPPPRGRTERDSSSSAERDGSVTDGSRDYKKAKYETRPSHLGEGRVSDCVRRTSSMASDRWYDSVSQYEMASHRSRGHYSASTKSYDGIYLV